MRRLLPVLFLLLGLGCAEQEATLGLSGAAPPQYRGEDPLAGDDDTAGDDDDGAGGSVELLTIEPPPGSDTHHYRAPLSVRFSGDATGVAIAVLDAEGPLALDIVWNDESTRATVWPLPRLQPDTVYTVSVDTGYRQQAWSFRTSRIGLLDVEPASLDGAVFLLDPATATVRSPQGFADAGASVTRRVLARLEGTAGDSVAVTTGLAEIVEEGWVQDDCALTGQVQGDDPVTLEGALVVTTSELLTVPLGPGAVTLELGWLEGDVTPDGAGMVEVGVSGFAPADALSALLGVDVCAAGDSAGSPCTLCPSGEGVCLFVWVDGLAGERVELDLRTVGPDDVATCGDAPGAFAACAALGGGAPSVLPVGALALALTPALRRRRA